MLNKIFKVGKVRLINVSKSLAFRDAYFFIFVKGKFHLKGVINLYRWVQDDNLGFRRLIIDIQTEFEKEMDKFKLYKGEMRKCCKCKNEYPSNTYFFASGGKDKLHKQCKLCEGTPKFGWGKNEAIKLNNNGFHYCSKCDRILPLNEFYFNKTNGRCNQKTGFSSNCKECLGRKFELYRINDYKKLFGVKDEHKLCSECLYEFPDNGIYFFNRADRENGTTICKKCLGHKHGIERPNRVLKNFTPVGHRYCGKCFELFKEEELSSSGYCKTCQRERDKKFNSRPESKRYKREFVQKRRAKKKALINDLTKEQYEETLSYFNNSCAYCGMNEEEHLNLNKTVLHQDHVVPLSKNGAYTKNNIIPACESCNKSKGNKDLHDFFIFKDSFSKEAYQKIIIFVDIYSMLNK